MRPAEPDLRVQFARAARVGSFCGSGAENLAVERWSEEDDPDTSYHVECLKCGCNGPQAETQLEGAEGWNGRNG